MSTATLQFESLAQERKTTAHFFTTFSIIIFVAMMILTEANFKYGKPPIVNIDWQIMSRIALTGIYGIYALCYLSKTLPLFYRFPGVWLAAFTVWLIMLIPFSISPAYSLPSVICMICGLLFVPALIYQIGKAAFVRIMVNFLLFHLCLCWVWEAFFPSMSTTIYADDLMETGFRLGGLNHPNATGSLAAICLILLIVSRMKDWISRKHLYIAGCFSVVCLIASDSRSSMISALAGVGVLALQKASKTTVTLVLLAVIVAGMIWAIGMEVDVHGAIKDASRTGDTAEITELNGRMILWPLVINEIKESPILGYGYGCQRFIITGLNIKWAHYHAHNLFLQVILGGGILAGVLLALMFLTLLVQRFRGADPFPDSIGMLLFVGGLAHAVAFSPIPDTNTLLFFAALFWRSLPDHGSAQVPDFTAEAES